MVNNVQPGKKCLVEFVKGKDIAGPDFGLELVLAGTEYTFHEASWRGVSRR
jgi:hypothetical protein